jgi:hypothetical protein
MRLAVVLVLGVCACGTGYEVASGKPDAHVVDSSSPVFPDAAPDAPQVVVVPPIDCEAGTERVRVDTSSGSTFLTLGCGDAGVPASWMGGGGEDGPWNFIVSACADGDASINVDALEMYPSGSTGHFSGEIRYDGVLTQGPINVDTWPSVGGLVTGTFAPFPEFPDVSGAFCVRRIK